MINFGMYATYTLIGIAVLAMLGFGVVSMIKNPKGARTTLIGIIGLAALFGITYATSTGQDVSTLFADEGVSADTSRRVGMGLTAFYILAGLTILSIVYVEIVNLFKK